MSKNLTLVTIYTDGACKGNPGIGGWGVVLIADNGARKELCGAHPMTTNNQMELQAVIEAIGALNRPCSVELFIDSQYVLKGMTQWMAGWKANNWRTASRQPVKNVEFWQKLDGLVSQGGHAIQWHWVKGHAGNEGNERADTLANEAIESLQQQRPRK